jgi:hypothetical protein
VVLLLVASFRPPPRAQNVQNPYTAELRDYIVHAQYQHPGERVCLAYSDLDALSLVWYARQTPVLASLDLRSELYEGTLDETMDAANCYLALVAQTGWTDPEAMSSSEPLANSPGRVLFRSDRGTIMLFDLDPALIAAQE